MRPERSGRVADTLHRVQAREPEISVVISARDAGATIDRAVRAATDQVDAPDHEVVVVDNASRDRTGRIAAEGGARVLRLNDRAAGPGAARNHGVKAARGSFIAFTDADCFPTPGWLAGLAAAFQNCAGLISGPILPDPSVTERSHWDRTIAVPGPSPLYATANLAVRRDEFLAVGGFQDWVVAGAEAPAHPYGEDTLMAWKLRRAGAEPRYASTAVVHHAVIAEGWRQWVARHGEMRYLPELVRQVPELREELLLGGVFASKRTFATSFVLAGTIGAGVLRSRWPLVALAPALWLNARRTMAMGARAGSVWALADFASSLALLRGSLHSGRLVA